MMVGQIEADTRVLDRLQRPWSKRDSLVAKRVNTKKRNTVNRSNKRNRSKISEFQCMKMIARLIARAVKHKARDNLSPMQAPPRVDENPGRQAVILQDKQTQTEHRRVNGIGTPHISNNLFAKKSQRQATANQIG